MKYAEILIPQKIGEQETLTYEIPENIDIKIGQGVKIPLRRQVASGIVWAIHDEKPSFKTLPIQKIQEEKPLLNETQIELLKWTSKYYFCPLHKTLKLFIPKKILKVKEGKKRAKKESEKAEFERKNPLTLTNEQQAAIDKILEKGVNKFLIQGVTSSGKTEIYTRIADHFIKNDKQVLIMVPEISLTPQIIKYFENSIGISAAVIHSKLSDGERCETWKNIWENKAKLIIGSRSAIFGPFQDLGAIIMDEEHELSYKQDNSPRYSTHRVVDKIQEINPSIKVILGSATPSIESAEKLKDSTIILKERIGNLPMPEIEIVDLRDEFKKGNYSIFSDRLREELTKTLNNKQQAILFLNRRGTASSIICRDCGHTVKCDTCELPMTYHAKTMKNPTLICHHCGKISLPPAVCPNCKSVKIKFLGIGTQKIEAELAKEFPSARVLRADKDTTSQKHGFRKIYDAFKNHEADILVGTQMIAKGLHLPKVNLVGVVIADIGLNIPDFRTTERNFQLMTQVAGRAGRLETKGTVIIQTYTPESLALLYAQRNDYENFFKHERTQRSLLSNPPFSRLAKLLIEAPTLQKAKELAEETQKLLISESEKLNILPNIEIHTYPAYIPRLRGKYRYIILIKSKGERGEIHKILENLPKQYIIDIDPITTT